MSRELLDAAIEVPPATDARSTTGMTALLDAPGMSVRHRGQRRYPDVTATPHCGHNC
ncbi:MAG: hypothetical protein MJE77_34060 [Proteobacteria bacterium]|nr:hypothetical protein [Pseudomonadota bacterium]